MKKILLALLLLVVGVQAQDKIPLLEKKRPSVGQAINLDGSSEYMSKSSPTNLDLNGAERVLGTNNTGFEGTPILWAGKGNHSSVQSSTDKKTGTYSLAITSSAAGNATNCDTLPSSAYTPLVAGEKYTFEGWARGTGVLGSELITNSADRDFSSDTGFWAKEDGTITISGGAAHFTNSTALKALYKTSFLTIGLTYAITFEVKNFSSGAVRTWSGSTAQSPYYSANGTYTWYFVAGSTSLNFLSNSTGTTTLDIDNVSIKPVTLPSPLLS